MERLSLFRPVSNAAVSGFLSHTLSDWAETPPVGWAGGEKPWFCQCDTLQSGQQHFWGCFTNDSPVVSWLYKACLEAANNCQQAKENFKKKKNIRRENQVPTCSAQGAVENPAACGAQGKRISRENLRSKALVGVAGSCWAGPFSFDNWLLSFHLLLPPAFWLLLCSTL